MTTAINWAAGDLDSIADDAYDDTRGETRETIREERLRAAAEAHAWRQLVEMGGELRCLLSGKWYASAPSGRTIYIAGSNEGDHEELVYSRHHAEQIDAVNDCYQRWLAAGAHKRPIVMPDDEWNGERDGAGPYWPEESCDDAQ